VANNLRELHREILEHLSPDKDLKKASWFTPDSTSKNGVTRRHRLTYAIYGYVSPKIYPSHFVSIAESHIDTMLKTLDELSKATHTTKATLSRSGDVEEILYNQFLAKMDNILNLIDHSRDMLRSQLEDALWHELSQIFSDYTFDALDSLSSHTVAHDTDDIKVTIDSIDEELIYFNGSGSVNCELQHGSNADCERGDGLEWSDSFPFSFEGNARVDNITQIEVDPGNVSVDTSSYYE
jgi:hypothetical protein